VVIEAGATVGGQLHFVEGYYSTLAILALEDEGQASPRPLRRAKLPQESERDHYPSLAAQAASGS